MRLLLRCLLVFACAFTGALPTASLAAARPATTEYVRALDWAAAQKLKPAWIKRDETLLLSGGSVRVILNIDSRQATVNGVRVWLLHPVSLAQGSVRLSRMDTVLTLGPLLAPPRNSSRDPITSVCVDAGHGGKDPGYRTGTRNEKTYTLLLARELRDQLAQQKISAFTTRSTDIFIDLDARSEIARRRGADLFISIHFNSISGSTRQREVSGAEVYCLTPAGAPSTNDRGDVGSTAAYPGNRNDTKNMYLAYQVQKALVNKLGVDDRGVQRSRFAVLREATMPAILVEAGFMSHPVESRKIYSPEYRKRIAQAIVSGVMAYKRAVETAPAKAPVSKPKAKSSTRR